MKEIIKQRTIKIKDLNCDGNEKDLFEGLKHMDGIKKITTNKENGTITIEYDLMKVNLQTIEKALNAQQYHMAYGLFSKIRFGWIHISEENEYKNHYSVQGPTWPEHK